MISLNNNNKNTTIITLMFLLYVTHFAQTHSSEIKSIYFTLCFEIAHYQLKTHYHLKKKSHTQTVPDCFTYIDIKHTFIHKVDVSYVNHAWFFNTCET